MHIQATFNNTIVTITDQDGNVLSWSSSGSLGFRGSQKGTPFAAQQASLTAANAAKDHGLRQVIGARQGARRRTRVGGPRAVDCWDSSHAHPRRHADPPQRVPAA